MGELVFPIMSVPSAIMGTQRQYEDHVSDKGFRCPTKDTLVAYSGTNVLHLHCLDGGWIDVYLGSVGECGKARIAPLSPHEVPTAEHVSLSLADTGEVAAVCVTRIINGAVYNYSRIFTLDEMDGRLIGAASPAQNNTATQQLKSGMGNTDLIIDVALSKDGKSCILRSVDAITDKVNIRELVIG